MPKKRKSNDFIIPSIEKYTVKKPRSYLGSSRCSKEDEFNEKKCITWFQNYSKRETDIIGPDGIERFCHDVGIDPENIILLVIAWKMNAKQMGYFTLDEWLHGLQQLKSDCASKLREKLDHLYAIPTDTSAFKCLFRYAYDFAKDIDQRSMDMQIAKELLKVLLGDHWLLFPQFQKFLEQSPYQIINKDQWYNILEFSRTISNDLSNYDMDGAWPVMLDEFVEWMRSSLVQ